MLILSVGRTKRAADLQTQSQGNENNGKKQVQLQSQNTPGGNQFQSQIQPGMVVNCLGF